MIALVPFGEPNDPFREHAVTPPYLSQPDNLRICAAELIRFMSDNSVHVQIDDIASPLMRRNVAIDCSAPFQPDSGIFMNDSADRLDLPSRESRRDAAILTLGDAVRGSLVTTRWAQLRRQDNAPFGIAGLSEMDLEGEFEKWRAITIVMPGDQGKPGLKLWGEDTHDGQFTTHSGINATMLKGTMNYLDSISRAIARSSNKLRGL